MTRLYAPAAPFAEAIEQWRGHQKMTRSGRDLGTLAKAARVDSRRLREYISGEVPYLELGTADRLSIALGISLRCLAEEFKPLHKWEETT